MFFLFDLVYLYIELTSIAAQKVGFERLGTVWLDLLMVVFLFFVWLFYGTRKFSLSTVGVFLLVFFGFFVLNYIVNFFGQVNGVLGVVLTVVVLIPYMSVVRVLGIALS